MRNLLALSLLAAVGIAPAAAQDASVTKPEADKYYRIRHVSGNYLTATGWNSVIQEKADDNSQIYRFVPVEGQENAYNIQRMSTGMFVGSDNKWTSTPISRNIPLSQHAIEVSSVDENYITLRNLGQASNGKCMGTDNTEAGSSVYTDKAGTDAAKHLWFIEPADLYPSETEEPEDFYAEYELPDDERATAYEGYRLVFAQEFSTDGTPDHDIWNFEEGFKRNNEDQYYNSDKNCYIKDGVLVIEGRNVESEKIKNPKYDPFNKAWPSSIGKYLTWTSGSMQTKGSWNSGYTWNYGIYEVRAKVPQYVGSW
ncbi:MAG: hypothetical protein K2F63_04150, partial [Muribaculaceae bacterium]|nr:hypothetical protein [Muribaculaceae bacterium]